jgi:hypothetical protein
VRADGLKVVAQANSAWIDKQPDHADLLKA